MRLVSLKPDQSFHKHLIQRVVTPPQLWYEMTDLGTAVFDPVGMVIGAFQVISITPQQAPHRRCFDNHLGNGVGEVCRKVNPQGVLFVVAASHPDFNLCVASWINPSNSVTEVLLK